MFEFTHKYQVMFFFYVFLLLLLLRSSFAFPHYSSQLQESKNSMKKVFTSAEEANLFIGRHLLYNRFDFEIIVPGNLERECLEEPCTYEEAREVFRDPEKTVAFWNDYSKTAHGTKTGEQAIQKIDVIGLLIGLVAIGILLVIAGILIYYLCQTKCKPRRLSGYGSHRRRNSSILRRQEELCLHQLSLHTEQTGLPTYEQAVALRESYSPPPPYPGPSGIFKVFKKSLSLPGP